uniref:glutamate receptor ionotropic, kainate 1-like n=1 Tax=Styela clava TaxID=7725 RepID=UPI0019393BCF|nr:glutamate receptor ionotropic, kainate 1-like [Styela clava]
MSRSLFYAVLFCCLNVLIRIGKGQEDDRYASFGILSDNRVSPEFVKVALSEVWQENQSIFPNDNVTNFPSVLRVVDGGFSVIDPTDPSDVLMKVCGMLTSSPAFVLYLTNCNVDGSGVSFLASALRLPVLWIATVPGRQCRNKNQNQMKYSDTIDNPYFIEAPIQPFAMPRKKRRIPGFITNSDASTDSYTEQKIFWETEDQLVVGKFFASFQWTRLICLYDYSFDFSSLQNVLEHLGSRMKSVIVQKLPMNPLNGQFFVKLSKNLINDILRQVNCPDSQNCNNKVVFAIFCSERTTKRIIIDLLPFFHNKRVHFYIVDVGWKKNFLNGVLYSREFTIITKKEKQSSRQSLTYNENLKYLKDQFKYTLSAVSKVILNIVPPVLMTDANMTCSEGQFYPEMQANEFVDAIRKELGVINKLDNRTVISGNRSYDSSEDGDVTYLNTDVLRSSKISKNEIFQDKESELELRGLSSRGQFEVKSLIDAIAENAKVWEDESEFQPSLQSINMTATLQYDPYQILSGRTLRVATIEDPPFVMAKRGQKSVEFYGFSVSVLDALANKIGFKYKMYEVPDRKYGSIVNNSWNGLVGELVSKKADLAISAMTMTPRMEQYIDFTARYMDFGLGVLMTKRQDTNEISLFTFLRPFHSLVWYCILGAWFSVSVLLFVLNRVSSEPRQHRKGSLHQVSLRDTFWSVYSTLLQQGPGMNYMSVSSQIVTGIWWFFVLIIFSSYLATLTSNLTLTRMGSDVRSFLELVSQTDMNFGTVRDSSIYDSLVSRSIDDNPIWQRVRDVVNETNSVFAVEDGIRRVKESKGSYAFLWDIAVIEYVINSDPSCSFSSIQEFIFEKGYGIGVQKDDPIKDPLSLAILELQDEGVINTLKSRWWKGSGCFTRPNPLSPTESISLHRFSGLFCILGGGMVIASLVAICEICINARRDKRATSKAAYTIKDSENGTTDTDPLLQRTSFHPNVTFERTKDNSIRIVINGTQDKSKYSTSIRNSNHLTNCNETKTVEDLQEKVENQTSCENRNGSRKSNGYVVSVPSPFRKRKKFQKQKKTYSIS